MSPFIIAKTMQINSLLSMKMENWLIRSLVCVWMWLTTMEKETWQCMLVKIYKIRCGQFHLIHITEITFHLLTKSLVSVWMWLAIVEMVMLALILAKISKINVLNGLQIAIGQHQQLNGL